MYVNPQYRGMGVFKSLFEHVEMLALSRSDVVALRLYVEINNISAKEVYKKMGMYHAGYEVYQKDTNSQSGFKN